LGAGYWGPSHAAPAMCAVSGPAPAAYRRSPAGPSPPLKRRSCTNPATGHSPDTPSTGRLALAWRTTPSFYPFPLLRSSPPRFPTQEPSFPRPLIGPRRGVAARQLQPSHLDAGGHRRSQGCPHQGGGGCGLAPGTYGYKGAAFKDVGPNVALIHVLLFVGVGGVVCSFFLFGSTAFRRR
jgi:hypothetical protein